MHARLRDGDKEERTNKRKEDTDRRQLRKETKARKRDVNLSHTKHQRDPVRDRGERGRERERCRDEETNRGVERSREKKANG